MQPDEDDAGTSGQEPDGPASSPRDAGDARAETARDGGHDQGRICPTAAPGADRASSAKRADVAQRAASAGPAAAADRNAKRGDDTQRAASAGPAAAADRDAKHADGLRAAVLLFARSRLAPLSAEDAAAITALTDESELTELVDTLAQAPSVDEARAVLAAAIAGMRE